MIDVSIEKAYRLIANGSTVMISAAFNDRQNVMTNAWNCPLDFSPSKALFVVGSDSVTRQLFEKSKEFVVNIPCTSQKDIVLSVGTCHGDVVNKFEKFNIEYKLGTIVKAPCIEGCIAHLECKVIDEPELAKKYDIILAEIVHARVKKDCFDGEKLVLDKISTLHHILDDEFYSMGNKI